MFGLFKKSIPSAQILESTLLKLENSDPKNNIETIVLIEECDNFLDQIVKLKKIKGILISDIHILKKEIILRMLNVSRKFKAHEELQSPFKFYSKILKILE